MTDCGACGTEDVLTKPCNYCGGTYCTDHLLPERHNCPAIGANETLGPNLYESDSEESVTLGDDESDTAHSTDADNAVRSPHDTSQRDTDPIYESSPDISTDGSIGDSENPDGRKNDGPGRIKRTVSGWRKDSQFRGQCPACKSYVGRTTDRITQCSDCGWRPGLPGLRLGTHWPNYGSLYRRTLSVLWTAVQISLVLGIVLLGASVLFGTGITAIDEPVNRLTNAGGGTGLAAADGPNTTAVERAVHSEINERRTNNGLDPLGYDAELAHIARSHSQDMHERDFFAHVNPDGEDVTDRYQQAGYDCQVSTGNGEYITGGENLAQTWYQENIATSDGGTVRYDTEAELAAGIVEQWMNSPGHRENILTPDWQSEGIGIVITDGGEVFATQNFC